MELPEAKLNVTAFGSDRVPVSALPGAVEITGAVPRVKLDGPAVEVTDASFKGSPGFSEAQAARESRANRADSTFLEGLGAAVSTWSTKRIYDRITGEEFDNDTPINKHEFYDKLDFAPTADEREYLDSLPAGAKSMQAGVNYTLAIRKAHEMGAHHEVATLLGTMVDPVYLVVPPALKLGKAVPKGVGRVASGAVSGGLAGGVTALGEGPVADSEIAMALGLNAALGVVLYRGGKLVPKDKDFPAKQLTEAANPGTKPLYSLKSEAVRDAEGNVVQAAEYSLLPDVLQPNGVRAEYSAVSDAVEAEVSSSAKKRGLGALMMWNTHKTMSSFGKVGEEVADLMFDNNRNLSVNSLEAHREPVLNGLMMPLHDAGDLLRKETAARGYGTAKMMWPGTSREAYAVQNQVEKELQQELFRREQYFNKGTVAPRGDAVENVYQMANKIGEGSALALKEAKRAGVEGFEEVVENPGYLNRRWSSQQIENGISKLEAKGITREVAKVKLGELVGTSLRLANPRMDVPLSHKIGNAIIDRAMRKGLFDDGGLRAPSNSSGLGEMRDFLKRAGLDQQEVERGLDILRVQSDEAGKASYAKHRMDLDYKASIRVGTEDISVMDLIDNRVMTQVDQYNRRVATSVAYARKGLKSQSAIDALRQRLLESVPEGERRLQAKELFDNSNAYYRGDPAGARMNPYMRLYMEYGRSVSLAWSGLWQFTEYANAMGEYGLRKSLKYAIQEIPGFKQVLKDKDSATSLNNVLADHSKQSLRLRPYLARFEDGYEMDTFSAAQLSLQQVGQVVPMVNAMKYVHAAQANAVGNLILDRISMASKGNTKARAALEKFGLSSPVMDKLSKEINLHGFEVDKWDDAVWEQTRPAFAKMMDSAVLKQRMGDVPAFAVFDQVGKFIFTYRSFVLTAHNKVLAGGMERNGSAATALVLLYQFPLAMAAVQAQAYVKGQGTLDDEKLIKTSMGQMGGMGLFSEPFKIVTGQSNSFGAPAYIPLDRATKVVSATVNGDGQRAASTLATMIPLVNAMPLFNGMSARLKEE